MGGNGTNSTCDTSEAFHKATENAEYFTYFILVYPYFFFGMLGYGLFVLACLRQTRQEGAYLYQLFLGAIKMLEITSFTILSLAFNRWAGLGNEGTYWYRSRFGLMWFAAHVNIPLVNGFINSSMFLSLCMSADRVLALAAPLSYNQISKQRNRVIAFLICLITGFVIVGFDTLRFNLKHAPETDLYTLEANSVYMASVTATALANIRNGVLILAVLLLIACNMVVIVLYKKKMIGSIKPAQAANGTPARSISVVSEAENKRRIKAKKALTLLTICQSTLNIISVGFLAAFFVLVYLAPDFVSCQGLLLSPLLDATLQIATLLDFFMPLVLSKTFRRMVFPWCHGSSAVSIDPKSVDSRRR